MHHDINTGYFTERLHRAQRGLGWRAAVDGIVPSLRHGARYRVGRKECHTARCVLGSGRLLAPSRSTGAEEATSVRMTDLLTSVPHRKLWAGTE